MACTARYPSEVMRTRSGAIAALLALALRMPAAVAQQQDAEPDASDAPKVDPGDPVERARALFAEGIAAVKHNEWGEALAKFEASSALRAHAVTTYNMGACYRAMSRYTRARAHFASALKRHTTEDELPPHLLEESQRYLGEIDRVLARVPMVVKPGSAKVTVDGAPLAARDGVWIAGTLPSGPGDAIGGSAKLWLDPGAHVIVVSAKGYEDRVLNRTLTPGDNPRLAVALEPLRAQLVVRSTQPEARVTLDGRDIGAVPLELRRAAGVYRLRVTADGYEPYESSVQLQSGKEHTVRADLLADSPSVLESWWFWTAAGVVVTGAIVGTYFATRPEPTRPPLTGGGLGWVVPLE
jgi:PEGA domain